MNAIWIAVAAVSLLGLAFGAVLGYASRRFGVKANPVVEKIDEGPAEPVWSVRLSRLSPLRGSHQL